VEAFGETRRDDALLTTNIKAGSFVLASGDREFNLVWKAGDKNRKRALPQGDYRLRTIRVERMLKDDHWFLSSSGLPGKPRALKRSTTTRIKVGDTVHFAIRRAKRKGNNIMLGFALLGADNRGISVYQNDKRVPVTYKVLSKKGRVLAEGAMNYG